MNIPLVLVMTMLLVAGIVIGFLTFLIIDLGFEIEFDANKIPTSLQEYKTAEQLEEERQQTWLDQNPSYPAEKLEGITNEAEAWRIIKEHNKIETDKITVSIHETMDESITEPRKLCNDGQLFGMLPLDNCCHSVIDEPCDKVDEIFYKKVNGSAIDYEVIKEPIEVEVTIKYICNKIDGSIHILEAPQMNYSGLTLQCP
jgi:hypothetical protein